MTRTTDDYPCTRVPDRLVYSVDTSYLRFVGGGLITVFRYRYVNGDRSIVVSNGTPTPLHVFRNWSDK